MIPYLAIIAGIFAGDQRIKGYIEAKEPLNGKRAILDGKITITKHHNKGAVLNFMEKKPKIILGVSCVTFGYVIFLLRQTLTEAGSGWMKIGLSLITGGGFSNLYDRVKRGYVVDYFTINYGKLKKVIFNLADICIFVGSFFMILEAIIGGKNLK